MYKKNRRRVCGSFCQEMSGCVSLSISDTIAAIATASGEAGIGIVRISGPQAVIIADNIYRGKKKLKDIASHTINYGHIIDKNQKLIDEVVILVFRAPRSYTAEDVVEVQCHGGKITLKKILQTALEAGARFAEPGEFTKRAFLNGRIDLTQAEAVADLIKSQTEIAMNASLAQVQGSLSKQIINWRKQLLQLLAHIEVTIDYPEYDTEEVTYSKIADEATAIKRELDIVIHTADYGKIIRDGAKVGIIGKPNVGKSSLLNLLLNENRAIVTSVPGTTRDIIEEVINVKGIPVKIIDTAGIRDTVDEVEKIGIERTLKVVAEAEVLLFLLDGSTDVDADDRLMLDLLKHKKTILIINKTDITDYNKIINIENRLMKFNKQILKMSMHSGEGILPLYDAIEYLLVDEPVAIKEMTYLTNNRQLELLRQTKEHLIAVLNAVEINEAIDLVTIDLQQAWEKLGLIIGEQADESLLDQLFSQFCLGK